MYRLTNNNDHNMNNTSVQHFEEKTKLMKSWYQQWPLHQQQLFLEDLASLLTPSQKEFFSVVVQTQNKRMDFTRILPQFVSLHIFSFLDPQSLCRCAQVCWYWKWLSEMDQVWAPKCLNLGWYMKTPSQQKKNGTSRLWKELFVKNFSRLQRSSRPAVCYPLPKIDMATMTDDGSYQSGYTNYRKESSCSCAQSDLFPKPDGEIKQRRNGESFKNKTSHHQSTVVHARPSSSIVSRTNSANSTITSEMIQLGKKNAPWRVSTRKPKDIIRYNYLDNDCIGWDVK